MISIPRQGGWNMFSSFRLISDDVELLFFFYKYVLLQNVFDVTHLASIVYEIKLIYY